MAEGPWGAVAALIDRAPRIEDLRYHGLQLLAAQRRRLEGRANEPLLLHDEQLAAAVTLTVPRVLERVREAYDGKILLMKGPELARLYPEPRLRPYGDVDLLVDDAKRAQRALLAAGFRPVGDPSLFLDIHHLRPLVAPGLSLALEVHDRPKWPERCAPPETAELLARGVPATFGAGILALPPAEHALLVAAHAWAHGPLTRLSHLLDAELLALRSEPTELGLLARRWGIDRIWRATASAAAALFHDEPAPWPLRTWARGLPAVREPTVLEWHLEACLAPFAAHPPRKAIHSAANGAFGVARRQPDESWRDKLARSVHALNSPAASLSEHRRALADRPRRLP
jgi:putative nucleotidyltransferase-like protein